MFSPKSDIQDRSIGLLLAKQFIANIKKLDLHSESLNVSINFKLNIDIVKGFV